MSSLLLWSSHGTCPRHSISRTMSDGIRIFASSALVGRRFTRDAFSNSVRLYSGLLSSLMMMCEGYGRQRFVLIAKVALRDD